VVVEKSKDARFDYWLRVSTLDRGHPLRIPVKYEDLNVASMRFHARCINAYLYACQLGHIPEQLAWTAAKQGMAAHTVRAAYSSQECPRCHFVDRANRPSQKTFKCVVCGDEDPADHKAAVTLAGRWGERELAACRDKKEIKALLRLRHEKWKKENEQRIQGAGPPVQLSFWGLPETLLDLSQA
jgi:hypothetical protein